MPDTGKGSDERLMADLRNGDHQAFAELVRRHTQRFYAAAYRVCAHPDEAEDIVQEAFLKLWNNPQAWDPARGVKFTTWFYKVVTNLALDSIRKKKGNTHQAGQEIEDIRDARPGQGEELALREEQVLIEAAIQALPERQKAALNLCFYEGLSNQEAAGILGVGVKALESLLMRAKAGVRDRLMRDGLIEKEREYG